MKTLALMRVTNGGNMLNHSPLSIWLEKIRVTEFRRVYINLKGCLLALKRVDGYNHRGGVNNSEMGRWLNAFYGNAQGLDLLFEVEVNLEAQWVKYTLVGKVSKV